jgi:hypothetical protein
MVKYSKQETKMKQASCFKLVSLVAYFSTPEDGGDLFLQNIG